MQNNAIDFKRQVTVKLADIKLQGALSRLQSRFVEGRSAVISEIADLPETRNAAAAIRDRVLNDLEHWLLQFEQQATARGAIVHWAETGEDVNRIVAEIARQHSVRTAAKSKSMVSEECGLNDALEQAGVEVMETDLGEYILQLAHEAPSHIVAPVVHKNKEEVADLFAEKHQLPRKTGIAELCREAREILRPAFLNADMGISGANFLVAETGSALIVTNEGNGRLVTTLPRVHVAITGIEKVVPTLEDVSTLLRLLPRSATGQSITNYVSVLTGTRGRDDHDGPEHFHIVLLDNGRSKLLGSEMQEMLRCIRCGACMNHCPVYQNIGGHAYGWVYPGPMGSILTPLLSGLEKSPDLPNASTFCGACAAVCPVKIPLPDLLRKLREKQMERGMKSHRETFMLKAWAWLALRPNLYALATRIAVRGMRLLGGKEGLLHRLPGAHGWSDGRDFPAPAGRTFRELYRHGSRK
ncbi:lactate utilization protein B [Sideroxyarcus emersonii]|uniref:Lactate utilization protein B n=1 Tax=Sideroxyarcus emersonii TaxID=2764705 RepID=A0AAN2BZU4_9PROT|nr:LutB/LldF family L-lactate oxidation iron-sulfur protein [Sideroxyarcus emersonii]BCK88162.1 lactate utilization protein B [Sideroxyarcus emersonii]